MTRVRWWILALLFFGTSLNYLDRQVMSILAPDLQKKYFITDLQYGYIQSAFAFCYAFGQVFSGRLLDTIGTRLGYALSLGAWSLAAMLHGLVSGFLGFRIVRGLLGVTESPAFPAAAKAVAEWFPRRERAFAFGFINAGTNLGVIMASIIVPLLAGQDAVHWQWAFLVTGGIGLIALLVWIPSYRTPAEHPSVSAAELAHINSDPPEPAIKPGWMTLLTCRQAWAFAAGKFLTDSMWWFYMAWFPKYLKTNYQVDLLHSILPLVTIYLICDVGSLGGGWISSSLIQRGFGVNRARKTGLFICALCALPILFAQSITSLWPAVLVLGLVAAGHQGFSSNLYTLPSDLFPRQAVAAVAGFGGMCGYFGASLFQIVVGYSVDKYHNYTIPFVCAGLAYIAALGAIHCFAPKLEPARLARV